MSYMYIFLKVSIIFFLYNFLCGNNISINVFQFSITSDAERNDVNVSQDTNGK